ncbi:MAG: hypothetical protein Q8S73_17890 [Deltaproteobacteria bacterium]|nr:hypothetical protein [Myxococcales bacterium]MDP3215984.1 hypothetical protein [Deltaproteobacteria bacterium]
MSPRVALLSVVALGACVEPYRITDVRPVPSLARGGPRPLSVREAEARISDEVGALHRAAVTLAWHVRETLPPGCRVESLPSAEAIVVAQCPNDQLFDRGLYSFHHGQVSAAWAAVGHWIGQTVSGSVVGSIDVDVTGSVDEMYCCHEGFDGALRLRSIPIASCQRCPAPPRDRRSHAECNQCLSVARAVAVAESVWPLTPQGRPEVRVRARGAGTCWMGPGCAFGASNCQNRRDCEWARRVDVTLRLHPPERPCSITMIDPASILFCYQEASRRRRGEAAVGVVPFLAPPPLRSCPLGVEGVEQAAGSWSVLRDGGVLDLADGYFLPPL